MKNLLKHLMLPVAILAISFALYYNFKAKDQPITPECPDEMIVNRMPSVGGPNSSYYIKDGERKEISDYDETWVKENCTVPVQTVY